MTDDLVKRLRKGVMCGDDPIVDEAADRIEELELRALLLEGFLDGALNVIEKFVHCDTQEARKALEKKNDEGEKRND